jgi:thiosulfate reductase cytochrome b subunit
VLIWALPLAAVVAVAAVVVARVLLHLPALEDWFAAHPGTAAQPLGTPEGFPAWLAWSHFVNALFLGFIIRTAFAIRSKQRPPSFVTRDATRAPGSLLGRRRPPRRLSVHVWWHLVVDTLFVVNGVVYVVLLFASGHWLRLVPTTWEVVPEAVSAAIRYVAFEWPQHDGWVQYNALQLLAYGATVFIAAPLALLTGLRLSPSWRPEWTLANRLLPESAARRLHIATLWYFVVFTVFHVSLVLLTGAARNLNHIYAIRDDDSPIGVIVFAVSVVVSVALWVAARPAVLERLAAATGSTVKRMPAPRPARQAAGAAPTRPGEGPRPPR